MKQPQNISLNPACQARLAIEVTCSSCESPVKVSVDPKLKEKAILPLGEKKITGVRSIVEYIAQQSNATLLGTTAEEKAEIDHWLSVWHTELLPLFAGAESTLSVKLLKSLDDHLSARTFLVGHSLSLADLVVFASVFPLLAPMAPLQHFSVRHLSRWCDLIQHSRGVGQVVKPILFQRNNFFSTQSAPIKQVAVQTQAAAPAAPKPEEKKEKAPEAKAAEPKKEKAPEAKPAAKAVEPKKEKPAESKPAATEEKKEKKEAKPKAPKPAPTPAEPENDSPDVAKIDIRVGKIVEVKQHENADSLYVEQIDVGEQNPRTVVSGLVKYVPIDKMMGASVLVVCNLKPAAMRGVKSEGMVLCASTPDKSQVELLVPPTGSAPGERVTFDGYEGTPEAQLNPKKKVWERVQPEFKVAADLTATCKGVPFKL
eukprot:Colp12_sorted_trinity150504_noHs@23501